MPFYSSTTEDLLQAILNAITGNTGSISNTGTTQYNNFTSVSIAPNNTYVFAANTYHSIELLLPEDANIGGIAEVNIDGQSFELYDTKLAFRASTLIQSVITITNHCSSEITLICNTP